MTFPAHRGEMSKMHFSPDGTTLATTGLDGLVKVWDITPARERLTVQPFIEASSPAVVAITFSRDGTMMAAGGIVGGVSLWNPVTGEKLLTLAGHDDWVGGLSFSLNGDRLATGSEAEDGLVKVWDTTTGELLLTLTGHEGPVNYLSYSPDGATIASVGHDLAENGQAFVWDATSGEVIYQFTLSEVPEQGWGIAYSPDGTLLATGTVFRATIRDMATGQTVTEIDYQQQQDALALYVHFSADGSHLISGGLDGTVRIWDVETGQQVREIHADQHFIQGLSLSPDGTIIATAAGGSEVRLWDYQSGERLLTVEGVGEVGYAIGFTPDGRQLVTGNNDGDVRFYTLSIDELVDLAESRLTRTLTEAECQQYLHLEACPEG